MRALYFCFTFVGARQPQMLINMWKRCSNSKCGCNHPLFAAARIWYFGEWVTAKSKTYGVTLSLLQPRAYLTDSTKTNAHAHSQRKRKCWQRRENTCSLSLCGRCNGQLRISAAHSGTCTQFILLSLLQVLMKLNLFLIFCYFIGKLLLPKKLTKYLKTTIYFKYVHNYFKFKTHSCWRKLGQSS